MPQVIYYLPDGVVYAKPGQFLVCKTNEGSYKVYRIQNLYLLAQLLPVQTALVGGKTPEFLLHSSVAASSEPDIRYLVNEFEKSFSSKQSAIESVSKNSLGLMLPERFVSVREFTDNKCEVHGN